MDLERTQPEAYVSEDISLHTKRRREKDDEPTAKSDGPAQSRCPTSAAGSGCPKLCAPGGGHASNVHSNYGHRGPLPRQTLLVDKAGGQRGHTSRPQVLEWRPDSQSPPMGPLRCPEQLLCALLLPSLRGGPALPSPPPWRAWWAAGAQEVARGQPLPQQRATSPHPELAKTDRHSRTQQLCSTQCHGNNSPFVPSPWVFILFKLH